MAVEREFQKEWYALTGSGMKLNAVNKETVYGDMPNLLLQKWPAPEFCCVTKMDLSGLTDGEEAGVVSMGMEYALLTFRKKGEQLLPVLSPGNRYTGKSCRTGRKKKSADCRRFRLGRQRKFM